VRREAFTGKGVGHKPKEAKLRREAPQLSLLGFWLVLTQVTIAIYLIEFDTFITFLLQGQAFCVLCCYMAQECRLNLIKRR
jgi:hypothetical protein